MAMMVGNDNCEDNDDDDDRQEEEGEEDNTGNLVLTINKALWQIKYTFSSIRDSAHHNNIMQTCLYVCWLQKMLLNLYEH